MPKVKLRLKSGLVEELEVESVLEYEGKPFEAPEVIDDKLNLVIDQLNHVQGRVDTLEQMVLTVIQTPIAQG